VINRLHILTFLVVFVLAAVAQTQTFTTLYSFTGSTDGGFPEGALIKDKTGNLYGTGSTGGTHYDAGVVFEVSSSGTETVLHNFAGSDGQWPSTPLLRDRKGDFYGTAGVGGATGNGVVFKIDSAGNFTVLYSFAGGTKDGCYPGQGLIMDKVGNFYGTTEQCGASNKGTIFKLTPKGKETVLHSFAGTDGADPSEGNLFMDKEGNLYGVTGNGGSASHGVLYRLTPKKKLTVLYSFAGGTTDGCYPVGTLVVDKVGNFYGTTNGCGTSNYGTIWKMTSKGAESTLHNFAGGTTDGCWPDAGVILDPKGNLYGNTNSCGANGYGMVWELSNGQLTLLHSFESTDGAYPGGELLRDAKGVLYGITPLGGPYGYGTVWSYVP
jgi:uncharacterized repeat protein (TIGR03803 family)